MVAETLAELQRQEKEHGITPDPALDTFMQAETRMGKKENIVSDFVIKMLGLEVSVDAGTAMPHTCSPGTDIAKQSSFLWLLRMLWCVLCQPPLL